MNESELLARIQTVTGRDNRELLARFWLQMDASPTILPFTFDDLRNLNADGHSIFHAILGGAMPDSSSRPLKRRYSAS